MMPSNVFVTSLQQRLWQKATLKALIERLSSAISWILNEKLGVTHITKILDDFYPSHAHLMPDVYTLYTHSNLFGSFEYTPSIRKDCWSHKTNSLSWNWTTYSGPLTPYDDIDVGQHCLRLWLIARQQQTIIWNNVDLSSVRSGYLHRRAMSREIR